MRYVSNPLLQKKESDVWRKGYVCIAVSEATELEVAPRSRIGK
jgi:hypothetical protein